MKRLLTSLKWAVLGLATLLFVGGPAGLMHGSKALSQEKEKAAVSSEEAKKSFADAATLQNNNAFDVAIEEWEKFLKTYSKDPLAPKAQHYLGVCQLQLKQYDQAAAAFQAVIANNPKFELIEDSYINLGSSQYALALAGTAGMYEKAAETFAALAKLFPMGKYADSALFYQGESQYALGKKAEAAAAYAALLKQFEKTKHRGEALYALGVAQEELGKYPEAGATYDIYLKELPENPLASEVRMRKAETALQAGNFAAAEKMFADVATVKGFPQTDHAIFRQAYCVAKQDKFDLAAGLYARVAAEFPKSVYLPEATMAAGRCYYRADKLAEATAWLASAAAAGTKDSAEAGHWLCRIHIRGKKFAEAADQAAKLIAAGGDSPYLVNLKLDQADALYEIPERRGESLPLYAKLAADHPKHEVAPQALYNAAFTALELKNYGEGQKQSAAFLTAYPQDKLLADVKYVAAECNLQLKKYPEAEAGYKDIVAAYPQHADADLWRVRLGLISYLQKKYPETIDALSPVAAALKSPDLAAEAQFLMGASLFYTDKFAEAEKALAASVAANPKWRQTDEALLLVARAQKKLNKPEAKATIAKLIADFPSSSLLDQAHYRLGEFAYGADDFKTALEEYEVVITKTPDSAFAPYALYGKAWSQLKTKQFAPAAEAFTALLTKYPQHQLVTDSYLGRAMSRRQAGQLPGAIEDLDAYLKSNPDAEKKSDALYEKGLALVALKKHPEALTTFDTLLKDNAKYAGADKVLYEAGWAVKSQEKHAEAVPYFARLAKEHPASPLAAEALFHVGEDQYDKKAYAEAAASYAACAGKNPAGDLGEKSLYKLGWAHFQQKQYAEAQKQFETQTASYAQGPLAGDAVFMKAECLFRQEKYKDALPAYETATKVKASAPAMEVLTLLHGGQSAGQVKEWEKGIEMLSQVIKKFPESPLVPEATYELAWARQNTGKVDEALKDYETVATKSRDQVGARARFMMGEVYFEKKQHAEAVREFQRAMFGYGGETAAAETKNWQAKSGFEAGRCTEVRIGAEKDATAKTKLIADAKRFYTFLVEKHPTHELAAEAMKRLDVLAKL
ncbi:MAG: tetratricopeptide repeat protein [Pirellulaceae bacterium]